MARAIAGCCLAATLLASGCGGERRTGTGPWRATHDLIAELPAAEVAAEFSSLDPGVQETRRYLSEGWAQSQADRRRAAPVVWGTGAGSALDLPLLEVRDGLALVLDCQPFQFPGAPEQALTVTVNGTEIARLELHPRRARYRVELAQAPLRSGRNRVHFRYGYNRRPVDVLPSRDRRPLAVAWYGIRLQSSAPAREARVEPERSRLVLPPGAQVSFYFALKPASYLAAEDWSFRGARLEVAIEPDGGGREVVAILRRPPPGGRLALPGAERRVVRLSLRAEAEGGGAGGAMLTRPAIGRFEDALEAERRPPTPPSESPAPVPVRPNVVVYLIDTLRADRLGCYGYPREVSPAIDAFARDGVLFEHAVAQSSWTRAGVASLFTGIWPAAHGANRRRHTLSPEALTLAELLSAAGYRTAGIVTNPNVADRFGFAQGFDDYELLSAAESDAASVTRRAIEWLDREAGEGPFFLYLHTVEPHSPYDPPPEHRRRFAPAVPLSVAHQPGRLIRRVRSGAIEVGEPLLAEMLALYDGEIAANDEAFGALRSALEERGLYRDAIVAVLSDHGEEFYEHDGFEHGRTLFEESVRVPLVLKLGANGPVGRVARPVQHVDLLPTLLRAVGVAAPGVLEGRDLREVIARERGEGEEARRIFTYLHLDGAPRVSVLDGDFKLIQNRDGERLVRPRLFDLRSDPGETRDLAAARPVLAGYLATLIRHRLHASEGRLQAGEAEIDEELRRRLEAMGYL